MLTTTSTAGVNTTLVAKRRTRPAVENQDYAAFSRRVIRAQARRIAAGDVEELGQLLGLERELQVAIQTAVDGLRGQGYSWADIALRIGITRQAAHQRWATNQEQP
jgi:hypothetical protein